MARIKVQKADPSEGKLSKRQLYAIVCWYYPQYKLSDAQALPARDLNLLLKTAQKQEASEFLNLTQIAAAPHTKNGQGVKQLISRYKKGMRDNPEEDAPQSIQDVIRNAQKDAIK